MLLVLFIIFICLVVAWGFALFAVARRSIWGAVAIYISTLTLLILGFVFGVGASKGSSDPMGAAMADAGFWFLYHVPIVVASIVFLACLIRWYFVYRRN